MCPPRGSPRWQNSPPLKTLVTHLLAVGLLLGLVWFILQPIQGDVAMWLPEFASILVAAVAFILAGCFAWWRFGSFKALVAGDIAALLPMAFVSLVVFFIPVTATAALLMLAGLIAAGHDNPAIKPAGERPARVHPALIVAAVLPALLVALNTVEAVFGDVAPFVDYGLPDVVLSGFFGLAILFWLDGRPGALLGLSIVLVYFTARRFANIDDVAVADPVLLARSLILLATSLVIAVATARDALRFRSGAARLASVAVAAVAAALLLTVQVATPLALVAALVIERSYRSVDTTRVVKEPATA
jgi:hypothetical protein